MDNGLVQVYGWIIINDWYVLILVVVDNGLVLMNQIIPGAQIGAVLILVVVDNGLVHKKRANMNYLTNRLNPCCSGQWSRTAK